MRSASHSSWRRLARGVPWPRVVWRDALKAALARSLRSTDWSIGTLLSGSFVVEVITAWPGLGRLMLDALRARDVYLVAGCAGAGAIFLAGGTLVVRRGLGRGSIPRSVEPR